MPTDEAHCTWFPWCTEPAAHEVEIHTSDEVIRHESVCARHLARALAHGYVTRGTRGEGRG